MLYSELRTVQRRTPPLIPSTDHPSDGSSLLCALVLNKHGEQERDALIAQCDCSPESGTCFRHVGRCFHWIRCGNCVSGKINVPG
jgi:hypothetical protein